MTYKKPVIASNVGGIVDIVKDGKTGLLVPVHTDPIRKKDPQKLAEAINKILTDEKLAAKLSRQGYEFVRKNFAGRG